MSAAVVVLIYGSITALATGLGALPALQEYESDERHGQKDVTDRYRCLDHGSNLFHFNRRLDKCQETPRPPATRRR